MKRAEERLWRTRDGERLVRDGDPDAAILAYAAGDEITKADEDLVPAEREASEQPPNGDDLFDPSKHTVPEVLKHLEDADREEAVRVLDAEAAGQGRKGICDQREVILTGKDSDPGPGPENKAEPAPANKARSKPADK